MGRNFSSLHLYALGFLVFLYGPVLLMPLFSFNDGIFAVSNAREIGQEPAGPGRTRIRYADSMRMSTYLVAYVVGRLEATAPMDVDGVPLRIVHVPGKGHLTRHGLDAGAASLRYFSRYYGIPYPGDKLDMVALPDFSMGAMENLGCITYREALLLVDPERASQGEVQVVGEVVAHEIAHMWFGDLVTMRWWNGIWLNEAFASLMETLAMDDWRPDWELWNQFSRSRSVALEVDALSSTRAIEYPVESPDDSQDMFDVLTYTKGQSVLRMLERYLGDGFREGIRSYLAEHAYGNTETVDLWNAIGAASGEDVASIMEPWIFRGGYPLLDAVEDGGDVRITSRRFRLGAGDDAAPWQVPFFVRVGDRTEYALEGSIFIAGAVVQWLRDAVGLVSDAKESEALAQSLDGSRRQRSRTWRCVPLPPTVQIGQPRGSRCDGGGRAT